MFLHASQGAGALVAAGTRVFEWLLSAYLTESGLFPPLFLHVRRLAHFHWEGSRICPIWENSRPKSPLLLDFHSIGSFFKRKVTVSQNLNKLSVLRVFPDFDLKFLCHFFVS